MARYDAAEWTCARFAESVEGTLESEFGSARRAETLGRSGILSIRAVQDGEGLAIEGWYDSLAVVRAGPEGASTPDAAGILGGRYRGWLTPDGEYESNVVPFVPALLREVFEFSNLLAQFFPRLSPTPLQPGADWTDGEGFTIWRLADSTTAAGPVSRFRWLRQTSWNEGIGSGDSTVVVRRTEREDGTLRWRVGTGPLGWTRRIVARLELTEGDGRSELTQDIRVRRLPTCP